MPVSRTMPLYELEIHQGSRVFPEPIGQQADPTTGELITFLADGDWAGAGIVRSSTYDGQVVMTFTTADVDPNGTDPVGRITFDDIGNVYLSMTSTRTALLEPTTTNTGLQQRVLVGDLYLWNTDTPNDRVRITDLRVRIYPEATTS